MLFSWIDITPAMWENFGIFSAMLIVALIAMLLWRRREERRMEAIDASHKLASWGLTKVAGIVSAYAVGNYIGKDSVGRGIRELIAEVKEGGLGPILRKVGWKMVENVFCKDTEDRKELERLLKETTAKVKIEDDAPVEI